MEVTTSNPSPTLFHQACAVVSILESLVVAGLLIPGLIYWEVCFTFTSVLLLPWPFILAVQQYRGTFRGHPTAAAWALGLSSLPIPILVMVILGGVLSQRAPWGLLATLLILLVTQIVVVLSNWRWLGTLKADAVQGYWPPTSKRITVPELMLVVAGAAVVLAVGVPLAKPLSGISVPAASTPLSLPEGARDVTYDVTSYYTRYQCTVEEANFLKWFQERDRGEELEPIRGSVQVWSFVAGSVTVKRRAVTDGWYYRWRKEDQGLSITFDRQTSRLYYDTHSR